MKYQVLRAMVVASALLANALLPIDLAYAASTEADSPSFLSFIPLILLITAIWWVIKRQKKQSADNAVQSGEAKTNKRNSLAVKVLLVLGGILLLGQIIERGESSGKGDAPVTLASAKPVSVTPQWEYSRAEDAMNKGYWYYASMLSTNTVNFKFPHQGEQHGTLTLETGPKDQKFVVFRIEKGQLLCQSFKACTVHVRFDDEDAIDFGAYGPSDNSTETAILYDHEKFVGKMANAKRVRIATNIYQEGAPVFEFNVAGFDSSKYVPAK